MNVHRWFVMWKLREIFWRKKGVRGVAPKEFLKNFEWKMLASRGILEEFGCFERDLGGKEADIKHI